MTALPADDDAPLIRRSSGNVFADLGFPAPEEEYAKSTLALRIGRLIAQHGWNQTEAARALGIDQPKVSALLRGRLDQFSTERLLAFLTALDQDVTIVVRPKTGAEDTATLRVAIYDDAPATAQ